MNLLLPIIFYLQPVIMTGISQQQIQYDITSHTLTPETLYYMFNEIGKYELGGAD